MKNIWKAYVNVVFVIKLVLYSFSYCFYIMAMLSALILFYGVFQYGILRSAIGHDLILITLFFYLCGEILQKLFKIKYDFDKEFKIVTDNQKEIHKDIITMYINIETMFRQINKK